MSSTLPSRVAVIGGGRMGAGIAHAFLTNGCHVTVIERDEASAGAARERVLRDVASSLDRGRLEGDVEDFAGRLTVDHQHGAMSGADLVIEAVVEEFDTKVAMLRSAESLTSGWIATNTSSLSVDALAARLDRPERFLGLHFFNPVPASKLVEIVLGQRTDPVLADASKAWVAAIGKTPITVHDAPGFATSRLGLAIALEAMRMVEQGVASAEDIDLGMVLGYKFPVGPLALTDIVGLDVRLNIAESLHAQLGERFAPPQILRDKVARGELGRKSGQGFYTYSREA